MLSRRNLLRASLALTPEVLAALQHAHQAVESGATRLEYLDAAAAAEIDALAATIIPSGGSPGAKEAGVIYFIDRALSTFDKDKRELYREGLAATHEKAPSIAALSEDQRIALARAIEHTEFFETLRTHVIIGFLAGPEWGGNRGKAGWKLIAFDDAGAFQPPFGYYDGPESKP